MKKEKRHKRLIELVLLKDFAIYKTGDVFKTDSMTAVSLIQKGTAKQKTETPVVKTPEIKEPKKSKK